MTFEQRTKGRKGVILRTISVKVFQIVWTSTKALRQYDV